MLRIISSADLFAAGSWSAETFMALPCGNCGHGKGQHQPLYKKVRSGPCTQSDCECTQYVDAREVYHGT